jgi:hypothetical protein
MGWTRRSSAQRADDRRVAAPGASEDDDLGVRERNGRLEDPCEGGHEDPEGGVALGCCGDPGAQEIDVDRSRRVTPQTELGEDLRETGRAAVRTVGHEVGDLAGEP